LQLRVVEKLKLKVFWKVAAESFLGRFFGNLQLKRFQLESCGGRFPEKLLKVSKSLPKVCQKGCCESFRKVCSEGFRKVFWKSFPKVFWEGFLKVFREGLRKVFLMVFWKGCKSSA